MPFKFSSLKIKDVVLIQSVKFKDDRGFFEEVFKIPDFKNFGIDLTVKQINFSHSTKGVLRGLLSPMTILPKAKRLIRPSFVISIRSPFPSARTIPSIFSSMSWTLKCIRISRTRRSKRGWKICSQRMNCSSKKMRPGLMKKNCTKSSTP